MSVIPRAMPRGDFRSAIHHWIARTRQSVFARNAFYLTGITGIERAAALVQTVLLARALGINEYGVYGLLVSTIGFVSSVAGLQMGLTATVFVARYREHRKADAGAVIRHVMRFALLVSGVMVLVAIPLSSPIATWLLKSADYQVAVVLGCLFIAGSLLSGVQDGIIQGFEDFRSVALARLVGTGLTLIAIYPAALYHGLVGALAVLLAGIGVKYAILTWVSMRHRSRLAIPRTGGNVRFFRLVKDFSLPSMLASLLLGAIMWYGMYLLSRQAAGFAAVAVVSVGLQWRGPILLVTGALGQVAVPAFSRYQGAHNPTGSRRLKRKLMSLNAVAVLGVVALLVALGQIILSLYGKDFQNGWLVFSLLLAATVPKVLADVHMQELVGHGRMWRQFWLCLPMLVVAGIGFELLVPVWRDSGYALAMLASSLVFFVTTALAAVLESTTTEATE